MIREAVINVHFVVDKFLAWGLRRARHQRYKNCVVCEKLWFPANFELDYPETQQKIVILVTFD